MNFKALFPENFPDYELIDSGNLMKLEKFGKYILKRPESQALWKPSLDESMWNKADAIFKKDGEKGNWIIKNPKLPNEWNMSYKNLKFIIRLTPFGHVGIFPDQEPHWRWLSENIKKQNKPLKILNLFGYTGISSLVCASQNAEVVHIDASKPTIGYARENQNLSGLESKKIRWIMDDAIKFVEREGRRSSMYDGILMDPPVFGRGPNKELWRFEESFTKLLQGCKKILCKNPTLFLITTYKLPISSFTLGNILKDEMKEFKGETECGELTLKSSSNERLLSTSIFARWNKS